MSPSKASIRNIWVNTAPAQGWIDLDIETPEPTELDVRSRGTRWLLPEARLSRRRTGVASAARPTTVGRLASSRPEDHAPRLREQCSMLCDSSHQALYWAGRTCLPDPPPPRNPRAASGRRSRRGASPCCGFACELPMEKPSRSDQERSPCSKRSGAQAPSLPRPRPFRCRTAAPGCLSTSWTSQCARPSLRRRREGNAAEAAY